MKQMLLTLLLATLLLVTGCIEYDETITLNSDGSGEIVMVYSMDTEYVNKMMETYRQMAEMFTDQEFPDNPDEILFNQEEIRNSLLRLCPGIKLIMYEKSNSDFAHVWRMKFSFDDVNKIHYLNEILESENVTEPEIDAMNYPQLVTAQDDGTFLFYRSIDDAHEGGAEEYSRFNETDYGVDEDEEAPSSDDEADDVLNKNFSFTIVFPGEITESNATRVEGNTAVWEYKLKELNNPNIVQRAVFKN